MRWFDGKQSPFGNLTFHLNHKHVRDYSPHHRSFATPCGRPDFLARFDIMITTAGNTATIRRILTQRSSSRREIWCLIDQLPRTLTSESDKIL